MRPADSVRAVHLVFWFRLGYIPVLLSSFKDVWSVVWFVFAVEIARFVLVFVVSQYFMSRAMRDAERK